MTDQDQASAAALFARPEPGSAEARQQVFLNAYGDARATVVSIARQCGDEIRTAPVWPGAASTAERAEPAAGIRIARNLAAAAARVIDDYIGYARVDGLSWQEIGAALEVEAEEGQSIAEAAFDAAVGPVPDDYRRWDSRYVSWTCPACGQMVHDYGPYESHPADNERDHGDGCERLAAAVAAHDAEWGDE